MKKELHDILLKFDLADFECPPEFVRDAAISGVLKVQPFLEAVLQEPLQLETWFEDASYFAEFRVAHIVPGMPHGSIKQVATNFSIRFSCFGRMVTICVWESGQENFPVTELADRLSEHGFVYVPEAALQEKYDGRTWTYEQAPTWFRRFFDFS